MYRLGGLQYKSRCFNLLAASVGSGPRYQVLSHVFSTMRESKNPRPCENRVQFSGHRLSLSVIQDLKWQSGPKEFQHSAILNRCGTIEQMLLCRILQKLIFCVLKTRQYDKIIGLSGCWLDNRNNGEDSQELYTIAIIQHSLRPLKFTIASSDLFHYCQADWKKWCWWWFVSLQFLIL